MNKFPTRVYYEDTDSGSVVYYANYLKFAERARTEWLRELGFEQSRLWEEEKIAFVVRRCEVDFLRPARLDDLLTITTQVEDIAGASLSMRQTISRGEEQLVTLAVRLGIVGQDFRPTRLPRAVRERLAEVG